MISGRKVPIFRLLNICFAVFTPKVILSMNLLKEPPGKSLLPSFGGLARTGANARCEVAVKDGWVLPGGYKKGENEMEPGPEQRLLMPLPGLSSIYSPRNSVFDIFLHF
jgi:hypothetical protein